MLRWIVALNFMELLNEIFRRYYIIQSQNHGCAIVIIYSERKGLIKRN